MHSVAFCMRESEVHTLLIFGFARDAFGEHSVLICVACLAIPF